MLPILYLFRHPHPYPEEYPFVRKIYTLVLSIQAEKREIYFHNRITENGSVKIVIACEHAPCEIPGIDHPR